MLTLLAMSSIAYAQPGTGVEPGVHIDPGSPAAKEYALPLSQARQIGAEAASSGSSSGPLFGAGIGPPGAGGSSQPGSGPARAADRVGASGANASALVRQAALAASALRGSSSPGGSSGSDGSILALLAGGVAVLALGGFGGMVLRRRRPFTRARPSTGAG